MKRILYFISAVAVNIVLVIVFRSRMNINASSLLPLFLVVWMSFYAVYYNNHRRREDITTNYYSPDLTDTEWERVAVCTRDAYAFSVPLYVPFIFFFSTWVKLLFALFISVASASFGGILFRLRYGRELRERYDKEKKELDEQKRREESGRLR